VISEAAAALVAANLPSLTGRALDAVRVNAAANGVEFANVTAAGWALLGDASGSAPLYACRAWVNFQGTGTVAIRASGNVSSVTDNGVGDYTVNFATAMPDPNFCYTHAYTSELNVQHAVGFFEGISAGSLRVKHFNTANSANTADKALVCIAIFR
jgi:hypothetical protein